MFEILDSASKVSSIGVIAIMAVIIYQLITGKNLIGRTRKVELKDHSQAQPFDESSTFAESTPIGAALKILNAKLEKIASNHLHDLPEMKRTLDAIAKEQIEQGKQVASLQSTISIILRKVDL